ncbi:hypothetical protein SKAU_G00160980 [Synaphobranchus kaupii]|uniref:Uncharacterized protein n=1 Tax=Synaphobranchus kaupii TaxID=118154 RepID=A0A9Q1FII0_SYNKA|nr:hypothetical protein SKAU_G00160980 [Synaphobranchus kaupii]
MQRWCSNKFVCHQSILWYSSVSVLNVLSGCEQWLMPVNCLLSSTVLLKWNSKYYQNSIKLCIGTIAKNIVWEIGSI